MEKKTPLYDAHLAHNARIVSFAGYLLPIQYPGGILHEHRLVREKAGLFDVSHMGELLLTGIDALNNLNYLLTNDFTDMTNEQIRYGILCYEDGGAVDDLLVYKKDDNSYLLVVNAANKDKDFAWIQDHLEGEAILTDISDTIGQIALQGPKAKAILDKLTTDFPTKRYTFKDHVLLDGIDCLISRTGYTGEDGFEIYCPSHRTAALWQLLLQAGEPEGLEPCGLGARDTLRFEAGMPLYGHELSGTITPMESNLGFFVKFDKDFLGKSALLKPPVRERIGLVLSDRKIAREGSKVFHDGKEVGFVTSGTFSPTLKCALAMALVEKTATDPEGIYEIEVRDMRIKAMRTPLPFYRRKKEDK